MSPRKTVQLTDLPLFRGLSPDQVAVLMSASTRRSLPAGALLVEEGAPGAELFVVLEGQVEVARSDGPFELVLARSGPGTVIGEVALVDEGVRSASVRAQTPVTVLTWPYALLRPGAPPDEAHDPQLQAAAVKLLGNLARTLSARLRERTEDAVTAARDQLGAGRMTVYLLLGLTLYLVVVALLPRIPVLEAAGSATVSFPVLTAFGLATAHYIHRQGYPWADFGFTTRGLRPAVVEALGLAGIMCALVTLAKWLLLVLGPAPAEAPLFELGALLEAHGPAQVVLLVGTYAAFTFLQEFVARGGIQTALERFLPGKHRELKALLLANLLFSATHLHVSPVFALAAYVPGLLWGWMYQRQRTLLGVTLNHALVGSYAIFVLGRASLG